MNSPQYVQRCKFQCRLGHPQFLTFLHLGLSLNNPHWHSTFLNVTYASNMQEPGQRNLCSKWRRAGRSKNMGAIHDRGKRLFFRISRKNLLRTQPPVQRTAGAYPAFYSEGTSYPASYALGTWDIPVFLFSGICAADSWSTPSLLFRGYFIPSLLCIGYLEHTRFSIQWYLRLFSQE
jgi:hypothetical protein